MKNGIAEALLKDANLVADFGSRAGRLRGNALFQAIQNLETALNTDSKETGAELSALRRAMNDAVMQIRPVTLNDLRSNRNPFSPKEGGNQRLRRHVGRYFFIAIATILIFFCAYYIFWLKDVESLRIRLAENKQAKQYELIVELYEDLRKLLPISSELVDSPKPEYDTAVNLARITLREKINRVKSITEEIEADRDELAELSVESIPFFGTYNSLINDVSIKLPPKTDCDFYLGKTLQSDEGWAQLEAFQGHHLFQFQFTKCIIGVEEIEKRASALRTPFQNYLADHRTLTEQWPLLLESWLLPALFGALGAVIYHLRACLNRLRPDPSLGRALMRVFLGAFAGISIGWFISPSTSSELLARTLPLGAYTLAFLIGYSIDVFFALLDKIVVITSGQIERIGPGPDSTS